MNRFSLRLRFGVLTLTLIAALSSCGKTTPKTPTDERKNKGHDQPTIAELTLTPGILKEGKTFSPVMNPADVEPTGSPQKIELDQSSGQIKYTEGAGYVRRFSVESTTKTPDRVYLLSINYKTATREEMNAQLTSDEQINRHQHFFKQVMGYKNNANKSPIFASYQGKMSYDYAYCDLISRKKSDGSTYLDPNPVGLSGFLKFVKPANDPERSEVTMVITLGHFFNTKFTNGDAKALRHFYALTLPGADTDINMTVHFDVTTH